MRMGYSFQSGTMLLELRKKHTGAAVPSPGQVEMGRQERKEKWVGKKKKLGSGVRRG